MILIKRYSNRKLYSTETSDYVSLKDVANLVKSKTNFKVVDQKTKLDFTRQIKIACIRELGNFNDKDLDSLIGDLC